MRHEVVGVVHVAALLDADEVFGGVEPALDASAGQKLLHRHVLFERYRGRLLKRKNDVSFSSIYYSLLFFFFLNFNPVVNHQLIRLKGLIRIGTWPSGRLTLKCLSASPAPPPADCEEAPPLPIDCDLRELSELERERTGATARRRVAPLPANKLLRSDGLRAQMYAWNDETVNTPRRFSVFFVLRDTCVSKLCRPKSFQNA